MTPAAALKTPPMSSAWSQVTYAKDQPEYRPLPVVKNQTGDVISTWQLTWRERLRLLLTGKLHIALLTFNRPLTPILPMVTAPVLNEDGSWQEGGHASWPRSSSDSDAYSSGGQ